MGVVNVRMQSAARAALEAAARKDRLPDSTWVREVVVSVLATGLSLPELQKLLADLQTKRPAELEPTVLTGRRVLGRQVKAVPRCLCPLHLREKFPTFDRCRECLTEYPR